MICEKCGNEMTYSIDGHSCSWKCNKCGFGLATSYFSEIEVDEKKYSLILNKYTKPTVSEIKAVSIAISCNAIEARSAMIEGKEIISSTAIEIQNVAKHLKSSNISFKIIPDFPYEF